MKRLFLLALMCLFLLGCASEEEQNELVLSEQKQQIEQLQTEIQNLETQKEQLQSEVMQIRTDKGLEKYQLTLKIAQSHLALDFEKVLKDKMNAIELPILVDKEYYDSVEIGDVLEDSFRMGSLILEGSIGSWEITVIDKIVL